MVIFTAMAKMMIIRSRTRKVDKLGCKIRSTDSFKAKTPADKIIKAITMVVIYSIRPWPKGCSLSARLPASFVPIIVNTDDKISVRLLTASRMIAIELADRPIIILRVTSTALPPIPFKPANVMARFRFAVSSESCIRQAPSCVTPYNDRHLFN